MDPEKLRETITESNLLFVYGTLLNQAGNSYSRFLQNHSRLMGNGFFTGRLFEIDGYPGAVYSPGKEEKGCYPVFGSIVQLDDPRLVLNRLDPYEGISCEFRQPHEYIRIVIPVHADWNGHSLDCWVYLYNWDTSACNEITSGRYL